MKEFTSKSIPPLLASFLIFFVVFGLQFSWGIYQTHYVNHLRILPTSSSSSGASSLDDAPADSIHAETHKSSYPWISLIGTTAASFKLLFALVAGKLARNPISSTKTSSSSSSSTTSSSSVKWSFIRGFKGTVRLGGILLFIGLVGASFFISDELSPIQGTPRYLALILFQGVMVGIGLALAITPATAAPSEWFRRYRGIAQGLASSGGGIGGLVLNPLTQILINRFDIVWTLRIIGVGLFVIIFLASFFLNSPSSDGHGSSGTRRSSKPHNSHPSSTSTSSKPKRSSPNSTISMLQNVDFVLLMMGGFVGTFGYPIPSHFGHDFSISHLNLSTTTSAFYIGILNFCSAIGRIVFGLFSDQLGHFNTYLFCFFFAGATTLTIWTAINEFVMQGVFGEYYAPLWGLYVALEGVLMGGVITLGPVVIADLFCRSSSSSSSTSATQPAKESASSRNRREQERQKLEHYKLDTSTLDIERASPSPNSSRSSTPTPSTTGTKKIPSSKHQPSSLVQKLGLYFTLQAVPNFFNGPLAALVLENSPTALVWNEEQNRMIPVKDFKYVILFSGLFMTVGACIPAIARLRSGRWRIWKWDGQ